MGEFLSALIAAPFVALRDILRLWLRWKRVDLQTKNHIRAGGGGFLCALAVGLAVARLPLVDPFIDPIRSWLIAGLAAFGLLFLVGGILGRNSGRDFFSAMWWGLGAAACVALLIFFKGVV